MLYVAAILSCKIIVTKKVMNIITELERHLNLHDYLFPQRTLKAIVNRTTALYKDVGPADPLKNYQTT